MDPKISVIVPHYNHNQYLGEALASVAAQTRRPHEVIIIDDGSDASPTLSVIPPDLADISFLTQKDHSGIGATLNCGIEQMSGDVFTWMPADDLWRPNKLARQAEFTKQNPGCVLHSYCDIWNEEDPVDVGLVPELTDAEFAIEIRSSCPYFGNTFWIPKDILDTVGPFREDVPASEDYEWVLRSVVSHHVTYRLQKESLAVKRLHPGQTANKYREQIPLLMQQFRKELDL